MSVKRGRPRDPRLGEAALDAAEALLVERGYAALTFEAIATLTGTSRPALYRRWRNRTGLITDLLIRRFGTDPAPDLGSLRQDLLALQHDQATFFADPVVRASLSGALSDLQADPESASRFHAAFMGPRRASTTLIFERAAQRGEIAAPPNDPQPIFDILTGPLLLRTLLPQLGTIDESLIDATVTGAIAQLKAAG